MPSDEEHTALPACEPEIQYGLPINRWAESERPREKLLKRGPTALTDAELIGLIFGSGTHTVNGSMSAIQIAQSLLNRYQRLSELSRRDVRELQRAKGIGPAKAVQLAAAFELGRRVEAQGGAEHVRIVSPQDVAARYGPLMRDLKREVFRIVLLNNNNCILSDYEVSAGGLTSSIVEPRAVFQHAILENAAAIICLHNHPSGNLEPSQEDIKTTQLLVEAGKLLGIRIHDHLIIAGRGYTSFAERGLMKGD